MMPIYMLTNSLLICCLFTKPTGREHYGNEICLLDATYKTSRYALPLFFLCIKTNVNYCVVGSFVIQHETRRAIAEALDVLREWNPQWSPRFFMTDFSDPEIKAIEEVFNREF